MLWFLDWDRLSYNLIYVCHFHKNYHCYFGLQKSLMLRVISTRKKHRTPAAVMICSWSANNHWLKLKLGELNWTTCFSCKLFFRFLLYAPRPQKARKANLVCSLCQALDPSASWVHIEGRVFSLVLAAAPAVKTVIVLRAPGLAAPRRTLKCRCEQRHVPPAYLLLAGFFTWGRPASLAWSYNFWASSCCNNCESNISSLYEYAVLCGV